MVKLSDFTILKFTHQPQIFVSRYPDLNSELLAFLPQNFKKDFQNKFII